jgi:hypothetical protein
MPGVSAKAAALRAVETAPAAGGDLFRPSAGLVLLLVITVLNVYKPRELTP